MFRPVVLLAALVSISAARADEVQVAVSPDLTAVMPRLAMEFEKDTGHKAVLAFGSSSKFLAQIRAGAPFQVLLADDAETAGKLEKEGLAVAGTRFGYALGRLVLWSSQPGLVDGKGDILKKSRFDHLAVVEGNASTYGQAAREVLTRLGVLGALEPKLMVGENVAQTWQSVGMGQAELGLLAASQVMKEGKVLGGSGWLVPANLHGPIRQDAVILTPGKGNVAAEALMNYLKGDKAKGILKTYGYGF